MDVKKAAFEILEKNRRTTHGHTYTVPSSDHYPYQWLWDSCFHAIVLAKYEPEIAKAELQALLARQFENGLVPHIIYWTPGILHLFRWGTEGTSSLTQPPMIAYAAWEVHQHSPDLEFLGAIFPALMRYYKFLLSERDPRNHNLAGIINPDESGEDNSPRFDTPLGVPSNVALEDHLQKRRDLVDENRECQFDAATCMRYHFWVKDVLFNTVLVENLRALARIASALHKEEEERFANDAAEKVSKAMRKYMFEDGVFWSTSGADFKKLKVATWTHMAPLFAGLYTPEEAEYVVHTHFRNKDTFKAPFGIRTTSKQEPSYRSIVDDFSWRGPVWFAPHWFMYKGLTRYGFNEDARWLFDVSVDLLRVAGFRECFNPETGEGYGAHEFTWGSLVLDMIDI